jgi:hypothetical protein
VAFKKNHSKSQGVRSQHLTYRDACDISKGEKCYERDLSPWKDHLGYNTLALLIMSHLVVTKEKLSLGAIGIEKNFCLIWNQHMIDMEQRSMCTV